MKLSFTEIAALVGGVLDGNPDQIVTNVAGLDDATPNDVSYIKDVTHKPHKAAFDQSQAGVIIIPNNFKTERKNTIRVDNPMEAFVKILHVMEMERNQTQTGIHSSAVVSPRAKIGARTYIGPHVVVEDDVQIGDDVQIEAGCFIGVRSKVGSQSHVYPNVTIREDVLIGDRCILHSGCVIGSDGYGFYFAQNQHNKIPQVGMVKIGNDVEIGSCTTIDRATTGATKIGSGTKIDNLVQIAHNVEIGENSLLVAQVGIGGSSRLGKFVVLAGQVGVADHVHIGDGVQVGAQSGVKDDIPSGSVMWGSPAVPIKEKIKEILFLRNLPKLMERFKK